MPEGELELGKNADGLLEASNKYGTWPVSSSTESKSIDGLTLRVPLGAAPGLAPIGSTWVGPRDAISPESVAASFSAAGALLLPSDVAELRRPQRGALLSVLGHWTTGSKAPVTVVMPTGTGKTETMLSLLVAGEIERLLVVVPSQALRQQVAKKFESLGVLQKLGILPKSVIRPNVGWVEHGFDDPAAVADFVAETNVIVATAAVLQACSEDARSTLLAGCSHLFVDEAHHIAASTWTQIRDEFGEKPTVQFTATPFREDGKHLGGSVLYAFPLREAQRDGYFVPIDYVSVFDLDDQDKAIASKAVEVLRRDLAAGLDHLLMARVGKQARTKDVLALYNELAADLNPVVIHSGLPAAKQKEALTAIEGGKSRIVVCVNMLGEGYDLPALKVAAIHDSQASLGVTLQFVGRFARSTGPTKVNGAATVVVGRSRVDMDPRLRRLYAEDADWNELLSDLSEGAIQEQRELSTFESDFTGPKDIALRQLLPKMSTVVYRSHAVEWQPDAIVPFFGEGQFLTLPLGLNLRERVAWCVIEHSDDVRWGDIRTVQEVTYELFVLYFDQKRGLLFINSSQNSGLFEELAEAVLGEPATRFSGATVYRVFHGVMRLVPTNVGVLDYRNHFRRFSMHVGSDVKEGFPDVEAQTKTQTHIAASGFRAGEPYDISASMKGRIWSHRTAPTLKHWVNWCDEVGTQLLDNSIDLDDVIAQFIYPEDLRKRPELPLLAVDWPYEVYLAGFEAHRIANGDDERSLFDLDLVVDDFGLEGPFKFSIRCDSWTVAVEAEIVGGDLKFATTPAGAKFVSARKETLLADWLDRNGLILSLGDEAVIEPSGKLLRPKREAKSYQRGKLLTIDWAGIDLSKESQGAAKAANSVQARMIRELQTEAAWDVQIDDDGSGEMADIVSLMEVDGELLVRLTHCKYSSRGPGSRVGDLYEVCGQAQKSTMWRRQKIQKLFGNLERRARQKLAGGRGEPFEVGDVRALARLMDRAPLLRPRFEIDIVQPGLKAAAVSDAQLELLASTETYLLQAANARLRVYCS
ncbi:DEAD/DEAH box helicase [Leifsonia aquatica]|uniref:DEAD/DEAH box helicase n=1 Tax=Leifsonia aquatica TaxID=144185 RepID=UPI00384A9481